MATLSSAIFAVSNVKRPLECKSELEAIGLLRVATQLETSHLDVSVHLYS